MTRTAGWYAEHPRAFDADVLAWNGREIDCYLSVEDGETGGTTLQELDAELAWWKMLEEIEPDGLEFGQYPTERTSR